MMFIQSTSRLFGQLRSFIQQLSDASYACSVEILDKASVGQHVRHILEFYICLYEGREKGMIDYENRRRDLLLETRRDVALEALDSVLGQLSAYKDDKVLSLRTFYEKKEYVLSTSFYREWVYILEHTIHHMALLRAGAKEVYPHMMFSEDFGVAESTMQHRRHHAASS